MTSFNRLLEQIDNFIRKFYKNQLIKGLILFFGVALVTFLIVVTLEFFGRFNSVVRGVLFFSFLLTNAFVIGKYIILPSLKLKSFGRRINRMQAASIIGSFFPGVSDRLLNTLQLRQQMDENSADFELLNASISQRSNTMSTIPFADAIDLNTNRKYVVWVAPFLFVLMGVGIFSPGILTQGTNRVVNFTQDYPLEAPFEFSLLTKDLEFQEGEDVELQMELVGEDLPEKAFIVSSQGKLLMKRITKNRFVGVLKQVQSDEKVSFVAPFKDVDYQSKQYAIDIISKTAIGKLQATLTFPKYLGRETEVVENASDLTVPEGTVISWSVLTKNSLRTTVKLDSSQQVYTTVGFKFSKRFKEGKNCSIILENKYNRRKDTTRFEIDVIKDEFPSIQVEEQKDTLKDGVRYFSGMLSDDYGLSNLTFHYVIRSASGKETKKSIPAQKVFGTQSPFDFGVDFRREDVQLNDQIEYYFTISDNDGVNGGKSTRSRMFTYNLPSLEELNDERTEEQENIKKDLNDVLTKVDDFKKDLDRLRMENLNSKSSDWNKQNQINQLQEEHKSILEELKSLQKNMETSVDEKNQLSAIDEEILKQQELIHDLLEELMDDELRSLLEELEKLMKEQNKEGLEEKFEEAELSSQELKDQLDRSLEALKKMQVNEKIDDLEDELKNLAKGQDDLRKETEKEKNISEEQIKKQEEIDKKFDELKKDIQELDSLNKELDRPMEIGDMEKRSDEISNDLQEAKDNLNKNKSGKAGESQKSAADEMKEMAEDMNAMQEESNQQQQQEDIDMLRNILESLVSLSFDQEYALNKLERVSDTDPAFHKYSRMQRRIIDDTKIVRDSLYELAKRQPKVASFIDKELNQIKSNHELSLEDIDERRRRDLTIHQQYTMTSYNNLALLLNESLQEMQQKMAQSQPGSGSCNKPGGKGSPKPGEGMSPGNMKEMLKKQLQDMQNGSQPGGKKGEKEGQNGQGGMGMGNKQIAKMAAEQGAIRQRLEQMRKEMNKDGSGNGNKLNPLIEELEQQEKDLVNKRLDQKMINRQKEILTRLLESEKAMMERGFDEKRESSEGKNENHSNQIRFDEYNKEKLKQIELLRAVDPAYNKYYKDRANEYFNRLL